MLPPPQPLPESNAPMQPALVKSTSTRNAFVNAAVAGAATRRCSFTRPKVQFYLNAQFRLNAAYYNGTTIL